MESIEKKNVILLAGMWGNGKGSVGNSLVGESYFDDESSSEPSKNSELKTFIKNNTKVLDGLCIYDSDTIYSESVINNVFKIFAELNGTLVIFVILKYGVRYTKQEQESTELLRELFGNDSLKNWGIVAFTYGDNFLMQYKDYNYFETWIREQKGVFADLLVEVNYRCVLFDNTTTSDDIKRYQVNNTVIIINKLHAQSQTPITEDHFRNNLLKKWRLRFNVINSMPNFEVTDIKNYETEFKILENYIKSYNAKNKTHERDLNALLKDLSELHIENNAISNSLSNNTSTKEIGLPQKVGGLFNWFRVNNGLNKLPNLI